MRPSIRDYLSTNFERTTRTWLAVEERSVIVAAVVALGIAILIALGLIKETNWSVFQSAIAAVAAYLGAWYLLLLIFVTPARMWRDSEGRLSELEAPTVSISGGSKREPLFVPAPSDGLHGGGTGPGGLQLVFSNPSPVTVERLSLVQNVWFHYEGLNKTRPAVAASPISIRVVHRGFDWDHQWDISDPEIWELQGLPVTIQPSGEIRLPGIGVYINDPEEALQLFTESRTAALHFEIKPRTNVGRFTLEAETPLVMSRMDGTIVGPNNAIGIKM